MNPLELKMVTVKLSNLPIEEFNKLLGEVEPKLSDEQFKALMAIVRAGMDRRYPR